MKVPAEPDGEWGAPRPAGVLVTEHDGVRDQLLLPRHKVILGGAASGAWWEEIAAQDLLVKRVPKSGLGLFTKNFIKTGAYTALYGVDCRAEQPSDDDEDGPPGLPSTHQAAVANFSSSRPNCRRVAVFPAHWSADMQKALPGILVLRATGDIEPYGELLCQGD